jgi:cytoskeleton protein RodZ
MDATERNQPEGDGAEQAPSLGQVLKAARTSRGLSLEQMSTELRIETAQLQALEQDDFERIGPPVFVKGYLRHFGTRVGLDYGDLLSLYYKQAKDREVLVLPSRSITLHNPRQVTFWIVAAIVLVAVMVALAVWWMTTSRDAPVAVSGSPAAERPAAARPQPAVDRVPVEVPARVTGTESAPTDTPAAAAPAAAAQDSLAGTAPSSIESTDASSTAADRPLPQGEGFAPTGPQLPFRLSFTEESWVEISDAHGQRLFYGLGAPGRSADLTGEPPILVLFGNAEGVQLIVNGEDYPIPQSRQGKLARFTLTAPED